ncbi:hypothetical protein BDP27DRAFT_1370358 [Rhodocollybia butyracea]|uniref:Uncharacterized protein n=1 Tax=Rhodocollybia butyracea TaxID=206335 RepID=A0A9P5TZV1_9AGAR|nr:hypothetical protein BDP27DRAFT_1370358 [Rhodocollybia butyracea]
MDVDEGVAPDPEPASNLGKHNRQPEEEPKEDDSSEAPPVKYVHGTKEVELQEKYDASLKTNQEDRKLIKALKTQIQDLQDQKESLGSALLGSKGETDSLVKTNMSVQKAYRDLIQTQGIGPVVARIMHIFNQTAALANEEIQQAKLQMAAEEKESGDITHANTVASFFGNRALKDIYKGRSYSGVQYTKKIQESYAKHLQ